MKTRVRLYRSRLYRSHLKWLINLIIYTSFGRMYNCINSSSSWLVAKSIRRLQGTVCQFWWMYDGNLTNQQSAVVTYLIEAAILIKNGLGTRTSRSARVDWCWLPPFPIPLLYYLCSRQFLLCQLWYRCAKSLDVRYLRNVKPCELFIYARIAHFTFNALCTWLPK